MNLELTILSIRANESGGLHLGFTRDCRIGDRTPPFRADACNGTTGLLDRAKAINSIDLAVAFGYFSRVPQGTLALSDLSLR